MAAFRRYLAWALGKDINNIAQNEIAGYMLWKITENQISVNYQNQIINAIKYYYENVLGRDKFKCVLPRPKKKRAYQQY